MKTPNLVISLPLISALLASCMSMHSLCTRARLARWRCAGEGNSVSITDFESLQTS